MLRTKAQQKNLCQSCPVAKAANIVGDSCTLLVMRDLLAGPKRFCELQQSLAGISTRTLTLKLKLLEKQGLLTRKKFNDKPPHVSYMVTKKGAGLAPVQDALRAYGEAFL